MEKTLDEVWGLLHATGQIPDGPIAESIRDAVAKFAEEKLRSVSSAQHRDAAELLSLLYIERPELAPAAVALALSHLRDVASAA